MIHTLQCMYIHNLGDYFMSALIYNDGLSIGDLGQMLLYHTIFQLIILVISVIAMCSCR